MDDKYKNAIIQLINNIRWIYFATGFMIGIHTIEFLGDSPKLISIVLYPILSAILWLPITLAEIVSKIWT